jgi:hypothetical protein
VPKDAGQVTVKKRSSPQEKKRLSYSRDRRNWYGENDKSSRKNIARRKRVVGERVASTQPGQWRKAPDVQLGVHIANALATRVREGISAADREQARINRIRRSAALNGTVYQGSRWRRLRWPAS